MSLVGNLEDLALGEILQIVSLSRKSGILSLESRGRQGRIVFRMGQVIQASSTSFQQNLGELLIQKGVINLQQLKEALALQEQEGYQERLGAILVRTGVVTDDPLHEVVREQIENVVYSLFAWAEGTFEFELQETEAPDRIRFDAMQFMLDQGLNPQYLAMEGSRILDERRHRGEELDPDDVVPVSFESADDNVDIAFDLIDTPPAEPAESTAVPLAVPVPADKSLLIAIDDDAATRDAIRDLFSDFFEVALYERSEDALIAIDGAYRAGRSPYVLIDLIMPRMDGSGILGGLELLELIRNNFSSLRVIVVSDHSNADAEAQTARMGYPFLPKPRRSEVDDEASRSRFRDSVLETLLKPLPQEPTPAGQDMVDLGSELSLELGEDFVPSQPSGPASTGISLLRGMLEELNDPALGGGVILLVLRFASEFMNRAVVFMVKKNEIAGLGQFGFPGREADARIRRMHIPRDVPSVFTRVIEARTALRVQPDDSGANAYLLEQLGGGQPREVFLGPLLSEGKVVAVLYGDNLPEQAAIGDTEALEVFLSQAGLAMEKALLQRRLQEKGGTAG